MLDDHRHLTVNIRTGSGSAKFGGNVRLGSTLKLGGVAFAIVEHWLFGEREGLLDAINQIRVVIPTNLNSTEKKTLRDLARMRGEKIEPQERGVFDKVKDFLES